MTKPSYAALGLLLFFACGLEASTVEERALGFLSKEVPRWRIENGCYSCHNNGDAARALFTAVRMKIAVDRAALNNTVEWLLRPGEWDNNRGDAGFSDKRLARIQFAASLAAAVDAGVVRDRRVLVEAAASLVPHQNKNGSWPVEAETNIGSPATYGPILSTYMARQTLAGAGVGRFRGPIQKADEWLKQQKAQSVMEASALVLAGRTEATGLLLKGQGSDGGYGPYVNAPSEAFDTALAMLALRKLGGQTAALQRARAYLAKTQEEDGGWPETTRPSGSQSYAQRLSTSGWATFALLETR